MVEVCTWSMTHAYLPSSTSSNEHPRISITPFINTLPHSSSHISSIRPQKASLIRYQTSKNMSLIQSLLRSPFQTDIWTPSGATNEVSQFANAPVDWKETPKAHIFKADLPGLKKEEVKVEIEDERVLQISEERSVEKEEKNEKWHRVETGSGKFLTRFWLLENAKVDEVKACMENGVLTVTVPKTEEKKPQVKSIEISG